MKIKKLESKSNLEKKQKRNRFFLSMFLIGIMVLSTIGFALNGLGTGINNQNNYENGYYDGQNWVYQFGGQTYWFANRLEDVQNISVNIENTLIDYSSSIFYIDSESDIITAEIANNLGRFGSRIQEACYGNCERDLPEKTCEDNMIIWRESEEDKIYQENNCVFIEGDLKTVDAFLYEILGFS